MTRPRVVSYRNSTSNHNSRRPDPWTRLVVSYRNSTSNHNFSGSFCSASGLYLIEILHQTTTLRRPRADQSCCILSKFYIKPQHCPSYESGGQVVSYRNSTSNHNATALHVEPSQVVSYRNSTSNHNCTGCHSTPESVVSYRNSTSNHNKPPTPLSVDCVVSYRNSTSNHNCWGGLQDLRSVVSYRNSTSNHNSGGASVAPGGVVSYRNSTSNHNLTLLYPIAIPLYLIEILHQTTTLSRITSASLALYLIEILHQTTTVLGGNATLVGCILSKFYIKPQLCRTYSIPEAMLYLIEILHQTTTSPYS